MLLPPGIIYSTRDLLYCKLSSLSRNAVIGVK